MNPLLVEEERRKQAAFTQAIREGRASPMAGMTSGYTREDMARDAAKEFSGEERIIDRQSAMAEQMRGRPGPQGREVGPLDVYVAPNWGQYAEHAANQLGGAMLSRSANKKEAALKDPKEHALRAAAMLEQEREDQRRKEVDRGFSDKEAARAEALAWRKEQEAIREAERAESLRRYENQQGQRVSDKEEAKDKGLQADTRKLTREITSEGITDTQSAVTNFFKVIAPFEKKDKDGNGTGKYEGIPGLGGTANSPGVVGSISTKLEDGWDSLKGDLKEGSSGMNVRAAYFGVLNQKIKDISGGAVPVAEWIRNQAAAGASIWNEEMDAVTGMREIQRALAAKSKNIMSGYDDATIANYEKNAMRGSTPVEIDDLKPLSEYTDEELRALAGGKN